MIRAEDQDELLDIAAAFPSCPLPTGANVGIVTISGGVGVWLADACEKHGLKVPELEAGLQGDLRAFIPDFGGVSNPVDITAQAIEQGGNIAAIELLYKSPQIDSLAVVASMAEAKMVAADKDDLARIQARRRKPPFIIPTRCPMTTPCRTSLTRESNVTPRFRAAPGR